MVILGPTTTSLTEPRSPFPGRVHFQACCAPFSGIGLPTGFRSMLTRQSLLVGFKISSRQPLIGILVQLFVLLVL